MATEDVEAQMESIGLSDDKGSPIGVQSGNLDQASFFRAVQDGHVSVISALLKNRKDTVDIDAYNSEGATALHLAVYKYEVSRNLEIFTTLLQHGANVNVKAAPPPSAHKISIVRHDQSGGVKETKKINFDHKTPLLLALELKSSLYLKGWEYRHWDKLLVVLSDATIEQYTAKGVKVPAFHPTHISEVVQHNWDAVFTTGNHEVVELVAEGKDIMALRVLVTGASKILKLNLTDSKRVEIHASYNVAKALVHFLYIGKVDPAFVLQRGIDLYIAAHQYGVEPLQKILEAAIVPTQENYIKLLNAAVVESNSPVLAVKVAHSIKDLLEGRNERSGNILKKSFSDAENAPNQFYLSSAP